MSFPKGIWAILLAGLMLPCPIDSPQALFGRYLAGQILQGTAFETPVYEIGREGPAVLVLAGVHGDEPGGWLAAEELIRHPPRFRGTLVIVPRANVLADRAGVRSKPEWGDLNRLYPGSDTGLPMAVAAREIVGLVRTYRPVAVLDLHESWDYLANMPPQPQGGVDTGFLGQTISADSSDASRSLARALVERVNDGLRGAERFTYFEFPEDYVERTLVAPAAGTTAGPGGGNSSSYLAEVLPGMMTVLEEVSQQLTMERRIAIHRAVVLALLAEVEGRTGNDR